MSAQPQVPQALFEALSLALSSDSYERDSSLTLLQQWSTQPGYYSSLIDIVSLDDTSMGSTSTQIKLQAALQFKNGVDKYWRKTATHAISPQEKQSIRPRLLSLVQEPDRKLANTIALCIAKIARLDYGSEWEALPNTLLTSLEQALAIKDATQARLVLHRTLLYIHQTLKSLSSNRMPKGRAIMNQMTNLFFPILKQLHQQMLNMTINKLQQHGFNYEEQEIEEIELSLLAFKSLSKMILYGFKEPHKDETVRSLWHSSLTTLSTLINLRVALLSSTQQTQVPNRTMLFLTKQTISIGKLYIKLFDYNKIAFVNMGNDQQLVETYWNVIQGASVDVNNYIQSSFTCLYPERFIIQSMLLLQSTLGSWSSCSPISISNEFIENYFKLLILKLLPLRIDDLERWNDDPEEWINEEEDDRYEFELRPCAEHVLKQLLAQHGQLLAPNLFQMLQQTSSGKNMENLLIKEGIYYAIGQNSNFLPSSIDFDSWLENTLIPEATGTDSDERIIRRRIAWLVGNFISEDLTPTTRTKIYSLLTHLSSENESTDKVIQLTSFKSLIKCCDHWDFKLLEFLPFLNQFLKEILNLLNKVELLDSKKKLNQTLGVIVDRVGLHILPYASTLSEMLSTLWNSGSEPLFQTSLLVTLTKLVEALENESQVLQSQAAPVIQYSVDPDQSAHVYLQEDALELWLALLKRCSNLSQEMISLLPMLIKLIQSATDVLPRCLSILESYVLINVEIVLQVCSTDLLVAIESILGDLKLEAVKKILHAFNVIVQTSSIQLLMNGFNQSNLMIKLLQPVLEQGTETLIVTKHLNTLSRIVLNDTDLFVQLVENVSTIAQVSTDELWSNFIINWTDKVDNMSQPNQRKLTALALSNLIGTGKPIILNHLSNIVTVWTSVLAETQENQDGDAELYYSNQDYQSDVEVDYVETLETKRRSQLATNDPIHILKLSNVINQELVKAQSQTGGIEIFNQAYLSKIDSMVVDELMRRLNGTLAG
ncbi:hypothetical protein OIO90_001233 [Microbotryomycetes sp. JL221]|nr:hypothetical protein OIO90_001233 [Microbotryomycetes sp. JL221]